jgi:HEPN domain-containing protein
MADQADLARELLGLARDDLAAADALIDVASVTDAIVGFHAQQAAEKALKAALAGGGHDFPFTHNLSTLLQLCEDAGLVLPATLESVDLLTPYGVAGRYGARSAGPVDRAAALALATAAVAWARSLVDE